MNAKHSLLAVLATFAIGAANAETSSQGWVSHAEAVFAGADAENLALAAGIASRNAWVAQADAVFAAADAENLSIAMAVEERNAWVAHADAVFHAADELNLAMARALDDVKDAQVALRSLPTLVER